MSAGVSSTRPNDGYALALEPFAGTVGVRAAARWEYTRPRRTATERAGAYPKTTGNNPGARVRYRRQSGVPNSGGPIHHGEAAEVPLPPTP